MIRVQRMKDETQHDPALVVPDSFLRIVGTFDWRVGNGNVFPMERVASGTCYKRETPTKVREVLETYMGHRDTRLSLNYGNVETGEDWLDEYDMEGDISRTTGPLTSPILVNNARSLGGGCILDACIIRIKLARRSTGAPDLYRHPNYHADREKHRSHVTDPIEEERVWNRRFA